MYKRDSSITESCKIEDFEPEPSILQDEVRKAMLSLGNGKAAGCDGIPIELLKAAGDEGHLMVAGGYYDLDSGKVTFQE